MARPKKDSESSSANVVEKKNAGKKDKDPNAPKRPRTAYILFSGQEGKKVRAANPEMSAKDVMREIGRRWSQIDPEKKAKFEEEAKADKERYSEEMESYSPPPVSVMSKGDKKMGRKKTQKDPNAPKRGQSAYLIFSQAECKKIRAADPNKPNLTVMKEAAARWAKLDEVARKPWIAKAATDKERFAKEMSAYNGAKEVDDEEVEGGEEAEEDIDEEEEEEDDEDEDED